MEIENIAIFDLYICSWYFSFVFLFQMGQLSSLETTNTSEKQIIEGKTSYKKSEIIPLHSEPKKTNKQKHLQQKTCETCFYCSLLGMCWLVPPLEKKSSKEAQLGASPPQQFLWMFLFGSKAVWSGRDGLAAELSYFRRCKFAQKKGWQEGVNVLLRLSAWKASQNLFLHTPFEFTHPDFAGSGLFCHR